MERIDNRIYESDLITETEANQMEEILKEIGKNPEYKVEAYNLIADGRLKEAATELERFVTLDDTFRCTLYHALLAQAKGDKETEMKWNELTAVFRSYVKNKKKRVSNRVSRSVVYPFFI